MPWTRSPQQLLLALLLLLAAPGAASADRIVPSERVTSRVMVRAAPEPGARVVGSLRPGQSAEPLARAGDWHRVRLANGAEGFVSAAWTLLQVEPKALEGSKLSTFFERLRAPRRAGTPELEILVQGPAGGDYRHTDNRLPVSGIARLAGGRGLHDIVLVLDFSTSTNEHTGMDVDGDGSVDPGWKGGDSIFAAQIQAARRFAATVASLPHNRDGRRVRIGIVSYAGDERFHLDALDAEREIDDDAIVYLARRDASVRVPLTGDYAAVDRALRELGRTTPVGMTDVAAGVGRALIELAGWQEAGAKSQSRAAEKVIVFLTDGKPRLPYDRDKAEQAARWAGRMAADAGVRINAFALGEDAVTGSRNHAVKRMARRSDGSYTEVRNAGDVIDILESTPFSIVDRVRIVNRTTEARSDYLATGIDGSFYGEITLAPGPNVIEVAATTSDGRRRSESFEVTYQNARPVAELEQQLKQIRVENEALIEKIKADMTREIRSARKRQQRALRVSGDAGPDELPANQR